MGEVALTWPPARGPLTHPGAGGLTHPARRVRRCLFGAADHAKIKLDFENEYKRMCDENKQRWNFDFEQDRPLPAGRYKWEKVPPDNEDPKDPITKSSKQQTQITDYMRKRKSSDKDSSPPLPKTRRRSST